MDEIIRQLERVRRRWLIRVLILGTAWSLGVATTSAAGLMIFERMARSRPAGNADFLIILAVLLAGLLATLARGLAGRPRLVDVAVWTDRRFGLFDRLSSGLEAHLQGAPTLVDRALIDDAVRSARSIDYRSLVPIPMQRLAQLTALPLLLLVAYRALPPVASAPLESHPTGAWLLEEERTEALVTVRRIAFLVEREAVASEDDRLHELAQSFERVSEMLEAGLLDRGAYQAEVDKILDQVARSYELSSSLGLRQGDGEGEPPPGETLSTRSPGTLKPGEEAPTDKGLRSDVIERTEGPAQNELTLDTLLDRLEVEALARAKPESGADLDDVRFRAGEGELYPGDYFDNPELRAANERIRENIRRQQAAEARDSGAALNGPGMAGAEAGNADVPLDQGTPGGLSAEQLEMERTMILPASGRSTGGRVELHAPPTNVREGGGAAASAPNDWRRAAEVEQSPASASFEHRELIARYFLPRTVSAVPSAVDPRTGSGVR